jgi:hypothetical protein
MPLTLRTTVAATFAVVLAAALLLAATATAFAQPGSTRGMAQMHELMMSGNPGMARMHELMLSDNPGMTRMHERMMSGEFDAAHDEMMSGMGGMMGSTR